MKQFTQCKLVWVGVHTPEMRRNAVELAHLAGFYSVHMQFPAAVAPDEATDPDILYLWPGKAPRRAGVVPVRLEGDMAAQWREVFEQLGALGPFAQAVSPPEGYRAANEQAQQFPHLPCAGLDVLFSPGPMLPDRDSDGISDGVACRLLLPDSADEAQFLAACDVAARLGMETAGIRFPLTLAEDDGESPLIRFRAAPRPAAVLEDASRCVVTFEGSGSALTDFCAQFCTQFPHAADHRTLGDGARLLESAVRMENADGQAAVLSQLANQPAEALLSSDAPLDALRPLFPQADLEHYTELQPVAQWRHTCEWEVDEARRVLEQALSDIVPGRAAVLHGILGEDAGVRRELADWFCRQALSRGASSACAEVLCAYKPGLSWLEESFAPRAASAGSVARVEIFFNPHNRPGAPVPRESGSPWEKVDDLVDKPPRWLEELYPADELMAPLLGISKESITFEAYAGPEDITYEARAYDSSGRCLLRDALLVPVHEQLYLPQYPEAGVCAPTTGRLHVRSGGRTLLDCRIATDSERLWAFYQSQVLPELGRFIVDKTQGGEPSLPLFGRLELDIAMSEPERPLDTRSDILSMGEVLSEDLFDAGKAYIQALCMEKWGRRLDAAGHILPRVHIRPGAPGMTATLLDHLAPGPRILSGGRCILPSDETVSASVTAVTQNVKGLVPHFSISCPEELAGRLQPLSELTARGLTALSRLLSPYGGLALRCGGKQFDVSLPPSTPVSKDLRIDDIDLKPGEVIGYDDWEDMARKLMRVPGLDVYPAGATFYGRTIYAVELPCSYPGYVSMVKRLTRGPSLLVGGRHHGNELSASNAMAALIRALVTEPELKNLGDRLCLTLIPMENADACALHAELAREHPGWAHHSCYTPPLGRDLYAMYFQEGAVNADGQAFSALYRRVLPDAFIDVHGVPGHDWQHQFASLTGYKGLWIPRAMICAFYWYCSDGRYTDNFRLNRAWADAVAGGYYGHPDLQALNAVWRERFDKYSYNGLNLDYPCAVENGMLNYWIPCGYHPRHPYLSVRFPWVTSVSFTAEAADEGASGAWLQSCASAQLAHIRAGMDTCLRAARPCRRETSPCPGGLSAKLLRLRPLLPPEAEGESRCFFSPKAENC